MINKKAKNSAPNKIKRLAALKKTKIKLKIECMGFLDIITKNENIIESDEKRRKNIFSTNISLVINYLYKDSVKRFSSISISQRSPFFKSFSLLYKSSSLVSIAYSKLGPSTIASTGQAS